MKYIVQYRTLARQEWKDIVTLDFVEEAMRRAGSLNRTFVPGAAEHRVVEKKTGILKYSRGKLNERILGGHL